MNFQQGDIIFFTFPKSLLVTFLLSHFLTQLYQRILVLLNKSLNVVCHFVESRGKTSDFIIDQCGNTMVQFSLSHFLGALEKRLHISGNFQHYHGSFGKAQKHQKGSYGGYNYRIGMLHQQGSVMCPA